MLPPGKISGSFSILWALLLQVSLPFSCLYLKVKEALRWPSPALCALMAYVYKSWKGLPVLSQRVTVCYFPRPVVQVLAARLMHESLVSPLHPPSSWMEYRALEPASEEGTVCHVPDGPRLLGHRVPHVPLKGKEQMSLPGAYEDACWALTPPPQQWKEDNCLKPWNFKQLIEQKVDVDLGNKYLQVKGSDLCTQWLLQTKQIPLCG